ncbi:MAG: pectate lyase, partial [Clostridia bacterium]|nr:pectate lyase [Clostridia bacterium]
DLKWTFTEADDTSYAINAGLKAAVTNYKPTVILSSDNTGGGAGGTGSGNQGGDDSGNQGGNGGEVVIPEGGYVQNFTTDGKASSFFSINGNLSDKKGTVTYNGLTLSQCLKIESTTNISFTISEECTLILVFGGSTNAAGKSIKIDGEKMTIGSDNILTVTLGAGTHAITKGDSINLFYIVLTPAV